MKWLTLLSLLGAQVRLMWIVCGLVLSWTKGRHDRTWLQGPLRIWAELRPFYLPAVIFRIGELIVTGEMNGWNVFFSACYIVNWWILKDVGDDDRWTRRAKKIIEKIKQRGARLVTVPVPNGAS